MVEDLSMRHQPVSGLFKLPASAKEWARHRLSEAQVKFYREQGYLSGLRILTDEQVEALREELKGFMDPKHPGHGLFYEFHSNESKSPDTILFHALGAWRIAPGFHDLLWNPAFTVPAAQLLGGPARFWHDQLFCKPAGHGGVVAWHQDYSYWTRTRPMNHLTCWIGLDDSTRENGCLHYVPGSHNWKLLPITGLAGNMEALQTVLTAEQKKQFKPIPIELKKGEASFHHPLMVHGSFENRSNRPRRAAVINAFLDGTRSDAGEPLLDGVPAIPKGEEMGGQFFPLLLDPKTIPQG